MRNPVAYFSVLLVFLLTGCVRLTFAWADLKADGPDATPPVLDAFSDGAPIHTEAEWTRDRAPALKHALQEHIYGFLPDAHDVTVMEARVLDESAFGGLGVLKEYRLKATFQFGDDVRETPAFYMNAVFPKDADGDAPIILMETFCPRSATLPHPEVTRNDDGGFCGGGGIAGSLVTYVFGRYIATPPIEMILKRGYGVATIFPSEYAPDRSESGLAALSEMAAGHDETKTRWGAIAAWALGFSIMIDALTDDDNVGEAPFISWGHSRYGKAALVAAAFDERIDGVISHQSGTGGASLNRNKKGESVEAITSSYPHWFARIYGDYAGREETMPVDQHHLLALIAPRPVLLGNARRDVWSDPNGAFRAAIGADPAYELFGRTGLAQERLDDWRPGADLAFWIRPGTHGVVKEDWPAFLEFLDAHFGPAALASR